MIQRLHLAPLAWPRTADTFGFTVRPEGEWLVLADVPGAVADPAPGGGGSPGLWRTVVANGAREHVHELPLVRGTSVDELEPLFAWAAATRAGERDASWRPPARSDVEEGLATERLRVRSGARLALGELTHAPGRLALVFPELAVLPDDLSATRRAWLARLLEDAGARWRLVRFGVDRDVRRVSAEVDLSGVPAAWAQPLLQISLEALVPAVEWVLAPLSFLVDRSVACAALDRPHPDPLPRSPRK